MELVAEDADRLPGEEEAEVADPQRSKQRGAAIRVTSRPGVAGATVGESSPVAIFVTPR